MKGDTFVPAVFGLVYLFAIVCALTGFIVFLINGAVSAAILAGAGIIAACIHHSAAK